MKHRVCVLALSREGEEIVALQRKIASAVGYDNRATFRLRRPKLTVFGALSA